MDGIDEKNQQYPSAGAHYSGRNRIPNVHEFVASLDRDKRERDAKIEAQNKGNGPVDHRPQKKATRTVTDPVTGKEVEIDDVNTDFMKAVENPTVSGTTPAPAVLPADTHCLSSPSPMPT